MAAAGCLLWGAVGVLGGAVMCPFCPHHHHVLGEHVGRFGRRPSAHGTLKPCVCLSPSACSGPAVCYVALLRLDVGVQGDGALGVCV